MSTRHIVAAICISGVVLPFANLAKAEDKPIDLKSAGTAEASDVAFARCGFEYQGWNFTPGKGVLDSLDMYGLACAVGFTR